MHALAALPPVTLGPDWMDPAYLLEQYGGAFFWISLAIVFIEVIRGVPLISILFMASVMLPLFMPDGLTIDKLLRAQIAIIIFAAAYIAEAVRGGLQAIPRGQHEAANAMGLHYWQAMRLVVLRLSSTLEPCSPRSR